MGNDCIVCTRKEVPTTLLIEIDAREELTFRETINRNMECINDLKNQEIRDKTFQDFMQRKGKIPINRDQNGLTTPSARLINRYINEWVFIQLEAEWAQVLAERRLFIQNNHPKHYANTYYRDVDKYQKTIRKAKEDILQFHNVTRIEFIKTCERPSLHTENTVTEVLWSYFPFKLEKEPEILSRRELISQTYWHADILNNQNYKPQLEALQSVIAPRPEWIADCVWTWSAEMMADDKGALAEEYILARLDREVKNEPQYMEADRQLEMAMREVCKQYN
jgi:hypothetical protein